MSFYILLSVAVSKSGFGTNLESDRIAQQLFQGNTSFSSVAGIPWIYPWGLRRITVHKEFLASFCIVFEYELNFL